MVGIVLLAMVAAFLALRLYMVLGKRSGHEQALPPKPAEERLAPAPAPRSIPDIAPEPQATADSVVDQGTSHSCLTAASVVKRKIAVAGQAPMPSGRIAR